MKRFFLLSSLSIFAVLAAIPAVSDAQSVYRWVDANGRVQYSDQPPPSDAKNVQQKNVGGNSIQNNELSVAAGRTKEESGHDLCERMRRSLRRGEKLPEQTRNSSHCD